MRCSRCFRVARRATPPDARLAARVTVDALRRLAEAAGGQATVLLRGDPDAGAILAVVRDRGGGESVLERTPAFPGPSRWSIVAEEGELDAYLARRRSRDPDVWAIELAGLDDAVSILEAVNG